jgi:hypothetical protein
MKENSNCKWIPSMLLYYPINPTSPNSNTVTWLSKSSDGPYAGKHKRLAKCSIKLQDDIQQVRSLSSTIPFVPFLAAMVSIQNFYQRSNLLPTIWILLSHLLAWIHHKSVRSMREEKKANV